MPRQLYNVRSGRWRDFVHQNLYYVLRTVDEDGLLETFNSSLQELTSYAEEEEILFSHEDVQYLKFKVKDVVDSIGRLNDKLLLVLSECKRRSIKY